MTTANDYLKTAIDHLPRASRARARIEMELRAIVGEQVERGRAPEELVRQLGDPKTLAESYLSATPLVAAPFGRRIGAKLLDIAFIVIAIVPALVLAGQMLTPEFAGLVVVAALVGGSVGFGIGTVGMEYWLGQTPGKRMFGLQVVRESGAAISVGQAVVRQLPMVFQFYWVDVFFAFFTDRQQRAFELLSKTRVVVADPTAEGEPRRGDSNRATIANVGGGTMMMDVAAMAGEAQALASVALSPGSSAAVVLKTPFAPEILRIDPDVNVLQLHRDRAQAVLLRRP